MMPKRIHFTGICGVATSALAIALHKSGFNITGSDKGFFPPISDELETAGVKFYAGWHPEKMIADGIPDLIVAGGSGTSLSNPEIIYAKEKNIPILSLAEAIAKFIIRKNSIVIAGTWGKTTSSALLSYMLSKTDIDPSYFTGGVSLSHEAAGIGKTDWSVVEGDEYQAAIWDKKPKFAYYSPTHLLLTAVSWDHADLYPTEKEYFNTFEKLVSEIPSSGLLVFNHDHTGARQVSEKAISKKVSYGNKDADYTYEGVTQSDSGLDFTIHHGNDSWKISSPLFGTYQAENITGCFAIAHSIGVSPEKIIAAISQFKGLKRRMEKRLDGQSTEKGITIIDDIAHSPDKARSVLQTLREIYPGQIIAIYEPNIGSRQREIIEKYNDAFANADTVVIPQLTKLKTSDSSSLDAEKEAMDGQELVRVIKNTHKNAHYISDDKELVDTVIAKAKKGDVIAFLGSRGFRGMIEEIVSKTK